MRKGIDFPDIDIWSGIDCHNIRNGNDFQDFGIEFKLVYNFRKIGVRNGYVLKPRWHVTDENQIKCTPWIAGDTIGGLWHKIYAADIQNRSINPLAIS